MVKNEVSRLPVALTERLRKLPHIALAFSGGIDSRFLCHAARLCGCNVLAIHASGPHIPADENGWARKWAESAVIKFVELNYNPLVEEAVASNSRMRCYFCKQGLLKLIREWLHANGESRRILCDGSNLDDQAVFRPGRQALKEAGVLSPLAQAGLTKEQIRAAASETGLEWAEQPSRPCLLTRFPYDYQITAKELMLAQMLEKRIAEILAAFPPAPDFRLRFCPQPVLHLTKPLHAGEDKLRELFTENGLEFQIEILSKLSGFFDRACQSENNPFRL